MDVDVDITGAKDLWLLIEDVDSYDPARVVAGWTGAELVGPEGSVKLDSLPASAPLNVRDITVKAAPVPAIVEAVPSALSWDISGKGFTRLRAQAVVDEQSRKSDIGPAVRFFVFKEKPNHDQLMRVQGEPPYPSSRLAPSRKWTSDELADRLYRHMLARSPSGAEKKAALDVLGSDPSSAGVEDLLWALLLSPEFQYIH